MSNSNWLDQVKWDKDGLAPVIAQDIHSGQILMLAWTNREALAATQAEQRAVYWSRSRQQLWRKGEESGNVQQLHDIYLDCDNDALCYVVEQIGGIACHTGRPNCFFQRLAPAQSNTAPTWQISSEIVKSPDQMYRNPK